MGAGRDDQPGPPHPVLVELLDHDLVEQRPQLVADRLGRVWDLSGAHPRSLAASRFASRVRADRGEPGVG